jgi:subtilisin family serine protease
LGEGHSAVGGTPADGHGHGTHVSGTIGGKTYGVAKQVILHACRSLDSNGSGTTAGVVECIEWSVGHAEANGWRAVGNMSLGGSGDPALDEAVCDSARRGFLWAVAAGNDSDFSCKSSPARAADALTTGATASDDTMTYFSSYGLCLDVFAPGQDITSLKPGGGTAVMSGTSMASPHVAGAAALYLAAHPGATVKEVHDGVVAMATQDKVVGPGVGSPNRLLFVGKE